MKYSVVLFVGLFFSVNVYATDSLPFDWVIDSTQSFSPNTISTASFRPYEFSQTPLNKSYQYWLRLTVRHIKPTDETVLLTFPHKWGYITAFYGADSIKSGSMLALQERSFASYTDAIKLTLKANSTTVVYIRLKGGLSIYVPPIIEVHKVSLESFYQSDITRLWTQGIFFGIILIMGLYNLVIYLSVRDISYLYYTLSIFSIGTYFLFYYGFGIELIWPNSPRWDAFSYAFIIPITNWARLYFTKSYLHLVDYSFYLDKLLTVLGWVCLITVGLTAFCFFIQLDVLDLLVDWIGFLGTTVLSLMFLIGLWVYRKGYAPAKYFSVANAVLVFGGILFIFLEMGLMPDNQLTRYAVQIGVVAQVVLFSLGLSSRLNRTQIQLAQLELNKEREKKELIEEQRLLLIEKVNEQTTDLRELNQLKDKLLSIISHDLRNPLVSLNSFLNLLINHQDKLDKKEQVKLAEKARQSLDNLDQLLSNLLYWSRSQMNLLRLNVHEIEFTQLIKNSIQLLALDTELKNIKIVFEPTSTINCSLDSEMMEFVLRNIIGNAIKFSHWASTIYIELTEKPTAVLLSIKDEGVGMSQVQIEQIFTKYAVTSTRGTAKEKGSGLGLVLCREFIELHNGQLHIISTLGNGTEMQISLPK